MNTTATTVYDLFERVLREGPTPDEREDLIFEDRGYNRRVTQAIFIPGDIDPETGRKKRIWVATLKDESPDYGRWLADQGLDYGLWASNPYLRFIQQHNHSFGLRGKLIPPLHPNPEIYVRSSSYVYDTEDEFVEAVIDYINRRG